LQSNVDELVLVVSPKDLESLSGDIPAFRIPLTLAVGGEERSISVMNGLMAAKGEVVLVHDAARPLASEHLCRELLRKVHLTGGAIPVLPVADALKRVTLEGLETVNREDLYRAQTPQAFAREDLIDALKRFGRGARDESEAWNASGRQVTLVAGEATNIKVTYPEDLALAKMLLSGHLEWRTGHGYDIHPLVPGRPLVLGRDQGSVKARPQRPLGCRLPLPRGIRRAPRWSRTARHRNPFPGDGPAVQGRIQPFPLS
jgi:4-diphosphocytidyl-2-methyl-D-erithritol synthase